MNIQEVRELAIQHGLNASYASHMYKVDLIQAIQLSEGNFNCFSTAVDGKCDQLDCIWREDCFAAAKKLHG
jgi:hypothetical protein